VVFSDDDEKHSRKIAIVRHQRKNENLQKIIPIVSATLKTDKVKREKGDKKTERWYTVI